jgi:hypothetical protein
MNIIDLAQPGERAVDQDIERGFGGRSPIVDLEPPKLPRLLCAGGSDPGYEGINNVELKPRLKRLGRPTTNTLRDKGTKFFQWRHSTSPLTA